MKRLICVVVVALLIVAPIPCHAATVDDLRLYMGDKIRFRESETWGGSINDIPDSQAGLSELGRSGYVYTLEDAEELTAEALARNITSVSLGCERQMEARELIKLLDTVDSGLDVLKQKGRGDILPDVLAGTYRATVTVEIADHLVSAGGENGALGEGATAEYPVVEDCDVGSIGEDIVWVVRGDCWVSEPFGYGGSQSLLLGVGKDTPVMSMFNGVAVYMDSDAFEIESLDGRLRLRYEGVVVSVEPNDYYRQGAVIGVTTSNTLRVSLIIDDEPKNVLEAWGEVGKRIAQIWRSGHRNVELALGEFDSEYHEAGTEIGRLSRDSYFNPEDFVRRAGGGD